MIKKIEGKNSKQIRNKIYISIFFMTLLLIILIYVVNINSIPKNIVIFQGEKIKINTVLGVIVETKGDLDIFQSEVIPVSTDVEKTKVGTYDLSINLFGIIPLKNLSVSVIPTTKVVPMGNIVGLKMYTNGVLIVGMTEVEGKKPYTGTNLEEGDMIVEVNSEVVTCTEELLENVEKSQGREVVLTYVRDGDILETAITPVKTEDEKYKLGLWVRDAAAGVGTVSFYEPATGKFAALGHGIFDVDTEELLDIATGEFVTTNIISIIKGNVGNPGKIQGTLEQQETIGSISKNTEFGVFGELKDNSNLKIDETKTIDVALRSEIKTGKATILCSLDNSEAKEYEVEIEKLFLNNNENNKSMIIKIIDKELIEKTGGIVRGMSGAPIIQDGKLVGSLTHVLVSNPTQGYGVFADLMIKEMREVK